MMLARSDAGLDVKTNTRDLTLRIGDEDVGSLVLVGHYELVNDFHVSHGVSCASLFRDSKLIRMASESIVRALPETARNEVDALVSATPCGHFMAGCAGEMLPRQQVGKYVRTKCERPGELVSGSASLEQGMNCLIIIEHVLTGRRLSEIVNWIRSSAANVVGIGAILDRCKDKTRIADVKLHCLADMTSFGENPVNALRQDCPLCKQSSPLAAYQRCI